MSTDPLMKRSVLDMDREITRLRRLEKNYKADNSRLRADVRELEKRAVELEGEIRKLNAIYAPITKAHADNRKYTKQLRAKIKLAEVKVSELEAELETLRIEKVNR